MIHRPSFEKCLEMELWDTSQWETFLREHRKEMNPLERFMARLLVKEMNKNRFITDLFVQVKTKEIMNDTGRESEREVQTAP